jgi:hypothetical protein
MIGMNTFNKANTSLTLIGKKKLEKDKGLPKNSW